jgi:hypothetical protein
MSRGNNKLGFSGEFEKIVYLGIMFFLKKEPKTF